MIETHIVNSCKVKKKRACELCRRKRSEIHLITKMSDIKRFKVILTLFSSDKCNRRILI